MSPGFHLSSPKKKEKKSIDDELSFFSSAYDQILKFNIVNVHKHLIDLARNPRDEGLFSKKDKVDMRLISLTEQIYELQLRQFADSISRILFNERDSTYKIIFDPAENFQPAELDEEEYKELLSAREPINCVPVNDLFQVKERDGINNCNSNTSNKGIKINKSKIGIGNNREITIGAFNSANYLFCHHCKLRRQNVVQCQLHNNSLFSQGKSAMKPHSYESSMKMITEPKMKVISIHQGTLVKKDKMYYIDHYDGNIKELMDNYFLYLKKTQYECNKTYCEYCLKTNYNIKIDNKTRKQFVCPSCLDICSCSRCFRGDQLMKIVSCYFTLKGDIDELFTYVTKRNSIMLQQIDNLMILKIINLSSSQFRREMLDKKEQKEKEKELNETLKLKGMMDNCYTYFQNEFNLAKKEETQITFNNNSNYIGDELNDKILIGKKTYRKKKNRSKLNDDYDTSASSNENGKKTYKKRKK